jgi:hypothetical protein
MAANPLNQIPNPEDKSNEPKTPIFPTVEASEIAKGVSERLSASFDEIFGDDSDL